MGWFDKAMDSPVTMLIAPAALVVDVAAEVAKPIVDVVKEKPGL
ncbi:hypothetical protein [uncultured Rothia sp.]